MLRILLLSFCISACPPLSKAEAKEGIRLDLVTFNIRYLTPVDKGERHWNTRKHLVAEALRQFDADVIGIQEAFKSQLDFLLAENPQFAMTGVGRDNGNERGEYSAILYRKDRFELDPKGHGTFWLSDTPEKTASRSWGNTVVRICTWARLRDRKSGRWFYHFNTHFDHESQPCREQAVRLIATRIRDRLHPEDPFVLTGDFNAAEDNPAIRFLLGQPQKLAGSAEGTAESCPVALRSAFRMRHPDTTDALTLHQWSGRKTGPPIDYIFVAPDTEVTNASIDRFNRDGLYPSDHYPVRATLQLR